MKKILVVIPIIFKLFVSPSFSFDVNMKSEEMLRLESDFLIKDLSVGDKMTLEHWDFCVSENKLATLDVIDGDDSYSGYYPRFIITLLPSSEASLEVKPDYKDGKKYELHLMIPDTFYSCEELKNDNKTPSAKIIFIKTVNGFDNLRDYVNHLKENGHKIRN